MTSNVTDMRKALLQAVVDCSLGMPIAQENAEFTRPADGSPWASAFVLENQPSIASSDEDEQDGILQIDLNYKLNSGTADVDAKAQEVRSFFRAGRALLFNDTRVIVRSCGRSRGREVDGYWRISLTVFWYAYVAR